MKVLWNMNTFIAIFIIFFIVPFSFWEGVFNIRTVSYSDSCDTTNCDSNERVLQWWCSTFCEWSVRSVGWTTHCFSNAWWADLGACSSYWGNPAPFAGVFKCWTIDDVPPKIDWKLWIIENIVGTNKRINVLQYNPFKDIEIIVKDQGSNPWWTAWLRKIQITIIHQDAWTTKTAVWDNLWWTSEKQKTLTYDDLIQGFWVSDLREVFRNGCNKIKVEAWDMTWNNGWWEWWNAQSTKTTDCIYIDTVGSKLKIWWDSKVYGYVGIFSNWIIKNDKLFDKPYIHPDSNNPTNKWSNETIHVKFSIADLYDPPIDRDCSIDWTCWWGWWGWWTTKCEEKAGNRNPSCSGNIVNICKAWWTVPCIVGGN